MDCLNRLVSQKQEPAIPAEDNEHLVHVIATGLLVVIFFIIYSILRFLVSILEPNNYKLDMTSKKYCKKIAEVNNGFRAQRDGFGSLILESTTDGILNKNKSNDKEHLLEANNREFDKAGSIDIPVYPNGWLPIIESAKVKPGIVRKAILMGRDFIVVRSLDGNVSILDAYCPHMGVHIGIGGKVLEIAGDPCVECPFHGWTFRASDGQCVKIPYMQQQSKTAIPRQAKLKTWTSTEVDNFIYIWHHIDNEPPNWFMEPEQKLLTQEWLLTGRSCHKTNLDLRDMHENGADFNHFEGIHNDLFIFGGNIIDIAPLKHLQRYVRHHWRPAWEPVKTDTGRVTHMAEMSLQSWVSLLNLRVFDITIKARQIGPARVNLWYDSKWYGAGLLTMHTIALGGRLSKYIQHIYCKQTLFQCFMSKWVLYGEIRMLERDFFMWNHKKNIRNPIFIPEDKTVKKFRLWYSQFYKRQAIVIQQHDDKQTGDTNNNDHNGAGSSQKVCLVKELIDF